MFAHVCGRNVKSKECLQQKEENGRLLWSANAGFSVGGGELAGLGVLPLNCKTMSDSLISAEKDKSPSFPRVM